MTRYLHTSIYVNDLVESIEFYTTKLGLKLLPGPPLSGDVHVAFVGADWNSYIELFYDVKEHSPYTLGNRYVHLGFEIGGDLHNLIKRLRSDGVTILQEPEVAPGGTRRIAFIEDPNGVAVELIEALPADPVPQAHALEAFELF